MQSPSGYASDANAFAGQSQKENAATASTAKLQVENPA
jgi:hypothetical protein